MLTAMDYARRAGEFSARLHTLACAVEMGLDGSLADDGSALVRRFWVKTLLNEVAKARDLLERCGLEDQAQLSRITLESLPDRPVLRNTSYDIAAE